MKINVFLSVIFAIAIVGTLTCCTVGQIRGNGKIISQERKAENFTDIVLDGVGKVNIHTSENYKVVGTLKGDISGVGTIFYKGNPEVQKSITGVGKIKPL